MKRFLNLGLLVAVSLLAVAGNARAASPSLIPVQARLTDLNGSPLSGTHTIMFSLFEAPSGGAAVHNETHTGVELSQGQFVAWLGDQPAKPLDLALFRDKADLWLELVIDGIELVQPRFHLGSVPYAGFAQYCGDTPTLQGQQPAAFALAGHVHDWVDGTTVPNDWVDGDNDTLGNKSCNPGDRLTMGAGNQWQCAGPVRVAPGTVLFFNRTQCPAGWSEYAPGYGRSVVGAGASGTLGGTVGTKLADLENRAHTHQVDLPDAATTSEGGHNHTVDFAAKATNLAGAHSHTLGPGMGYSTVSFSIATDKLPAHDHSHTVESAADHTHSFDPPLTNASTVPGHTHKANPDPFATGASDTGTSMPYVQLLLCRKN